ncbi:MAG: thiamine-phosphate kinase [Gemmataceae bacterium]
MTHPGGEGEFIDWLRSRIAGHPRVAIGPGDDAAAIDFPQASRCLVTTDMLLDGACFRLDEAGPYRVGRKAIAVSLSDIAAMAGKPLACVISVGLPRKGGMEIAQELFRGMEEIAREFNTAIIGGDTNTWHGTLCISVAMLGEATERGPVKRSGAKPGDWIFVTGPLGGSILSHHLEFTPRIREALALHREVELHALTDISDGFALDLSHILRESHCGAIVRADAIPISDAARSVDDGRSALEHALSDGEDFELIFTVSPEDGQRLTKQSPVPVFHVGECVDQGLWIDDGQTRRPLAAAGYEHGFES